MAIKILYFASLREQLGSSEETLDIEAGLRVQDLLQQLCARGDAWQLALCDNPHLQVAVNQAVASMESVLNDGDEVAFFPPVTGG
jgi:molybdopterin synthase sulfur carrier subunit